MDDYESYDAIGLAALVRSGETTPTALLDAAVERLEKRNGALNAVVIPMLDHARRAIAAGLPDGPLRGVPFLLKDLHAAVAGVRLTSGSQLFADYVPERESELVTRYRRAGLVSFGKTHSPEFGLTTTSESRLFGQTRNPWHLGRSAGGSSGGAAAAVAAGIVPVAPATDGGGTVGSRHLRVAHAPYELPQRSQIDFLGSAAIAVRGRLRQYAAGQSPLPLRVQETAQAESWNIIGMSAFELPLHRSSFVPATRMSPNVCL